MTEHSKREATLAARGRPANANLRQWRQAATLTGLAGGRLGVAAGQLLATRISTTLIGPYGQGAIAELQGLRALFDNIFYSPVWLYFARGLNGWFEEGLLPRNLRRYAAYALAAGCTSMIASAVLQHCLGLVAGFSVMAVAAAILALTIGMQTANAAANSFNLLHRRLPFIVASNIPIWAGVAISALAAYHSPTAQAWIAGQAAGWALGGISFLFLFQALRGHHGAAPEDQSQAPLRFSGPETWRFAWPLTITFGLWWAQTQGSRFLLAWLGGPAVVGLFAVTYSLASAPIFVAEGVIVQFVEPDFYRSLRDQEPHTLARAWERYAALYIPALVLTGCMVGCAGPFLAKVMLGAQFQSVGRLALLPALAETMRGVNDMLRVLATAKVDTRIQILPVAIGAAVCNGAILVLFRPFGLSGALVGSCLGMATVSAYLFWIAKKVLPVQWPFRAIVRGLGYALPLIAGLAAAQVTWPAPGLIKSCFVLAAAGTYFAWAEFRILRPKDADTEALLGAAESRTLQAEAKE